MSLFGKLIQKISKILINKSPNIIHRDHSLTSTLNCHTKVGSIIYIICQLSTYKMKSATQGATISSDADKKLATNNKAATILSQADKRVVQSITLSECGVTLDPILAYLKECDQDFLSSQLYNSVEEKKFEDSSQRLSEYRAIVDNKLFLMCDDVVRNISDHDDNGMTYTLVRNDATHIRYATGGFFKTHEDYLSLTSNHIEEFTLAICVTPAEIADQTKGGRTIIHFGESTTSYDATTTPGKALLFVRIKTIQHFDLNICLYI